MSEDNSDQEAKAAEYTGVLTPALLDLMKTKRAAIKADTDASFRRTRAAEKRQAYREAQAAKGLTVRPRKAPVALPGEDQEDMLARLKKERNAADYEKRLARDGKVKKNVSRAAMTPDQVKAHEAKLKREKRAAAKKITKAEAEKAAYASNPLFGRF